MTGRNSSRPRRLHCRPIAAARSTFVRGSRNVSIVSRKRTPLLDQALAAGYPRHEIDLERAALLQATGRYDDALVLRERLAKDDPGIHTLGALASLLAEMGRWSAAENSYAAALDADDGVSPLPCGQLLFEWGVSAMRRGDLDRAEAIFVELDAILPAHVPGRGHRAEVALARGQLDIAMTLITPLLETSDDPEYRAIYAEILAARGDGKAASEAERAAAAYELLLARRPEAYADHAAAFFMGVGNRPQRAVELASANWKLRDTPRSRSLLAKALRNAQQVSLVQGRCRMSATVSRRGSIGRSGDRRRTGGSGGRAPCGGPGRAHRAGDQR